MPSLLDLADLDQGLILISGDRRSGKTTACDVILRRWAERNLSYRCFGPTPPPIRNAHWYRSDAGIIASRARGSRYVLIDEPPPNLRPEDLGQRLVVVATSTAQDWMCRAATWICHTSITAVTIYPGLYQEQPPVVQIPAPTCWERLLGDDA